MLERAERDLFLRKGLTSSLMAQGSCSVRLMKEGGIFSSASPCVFLQENEYSGMASLLNARVSSYFLRALSPELKFREGYVALVPLPPQISKYLVKAGEICITIKRVLLSNSITQRFFQTLAWNSSGDRGFPAAIEC